MAVDEANAALPNRLLDMLFPTKRLHVIQRIQSRKAKQLNDLIQDVEPLDPEWNPSRIPDVRKFFQDNQRDLGPLPGGSRKSPIPEPGDLRIILACESLESEQHVHVVSKDRHFTHYADLIQDQWGFEVHSASNLGAIVDQIQG